MPGGVANPGSGRSPEGGSGRVRCPSSRSRGRSSGGLGLAVEEFVGFSVCCEVGSHLSPQDRGARGDVHIPVS